MEKWKFLTGTNYQYSVSNLGRIKSHKHRFGKRKIPRILRPGITCGYQYVVLYKNGTHKTYRLAGLIARTFLGKRPKGKVINHKDFNRKNDNYKNLEYVTPQENTIHAWKNNRCSVRLGLAHPNHKLTPEQVLQIRKEYIPYVIIERVLAKKYGVHKSTINGIISRRHWKHI